MSVQPERGEELAPLMGQRATVYHFLAMLYKEEVSPAMLKKLSLLKGSLKGEPAAELATNFNDLLKSLTEIDMGNRKPSKEEMDQDYANLFLGTGPHPAFPYESVYLSPNRCLMDEPYDQVIKEYRAYGVRKATNFKEPEDHLAVELAFMARLCEDTATAFGQADLSKGTELLPAQRRFLEAHLLSWVPAFTEDVLRGARTEVYQNVAKFTRAFISFDHQLLACLSSSLEMGQQT